MPITYRIDGDLSVVYVQITGRLTPAEHARHHSELLGDPTYRPGMPCLVDWRDGDESNTSEEVRMMAETVLRHPARAGTARCAIVVRTDVQYGLTRVFSAFLGDAALEVRTFRKIDDACRWLGETMGRTVAPP